MTTLKTKPAPRNAGRVSIVGSILLAGLIGALGLIGSGIFFATKSIQDLLTENRELRRALTNLTDESQIGYAKVLSQETVDGKLVTELLFVETARDNPLKRVLEKTYTIQGDVVHFDALVVTFKEDLVMDGKERAMYLWRRVYGEGTPPGEGEPIETPGQQPARYQDITQRLSLADQELFWDEIWKLADNPDRLASLGVKAVYGNVVYRRLRPGLIYVFRISNAGTLYPESIPDL